MIFALGVLLYSLLSDPRLKHTKFLIVLTKMDFAYRQMRNEALLMLQYEKLRKQIHQSIEVVEASAVTCTGLEKIFDWLSIQWNVNINFWFFKFSFYSNFFFFFCINKREIKYHLFLNFASSKMWLIMQVTDEFWLDYINN